MQSKHSAPSAALAARQTDVVDAFLAGLEHPFKQEVCALRLIILGADARIGEALKWNAPSFFTTEHFATFNLRAKDGVQLVLHRGVKVRDTAERLPIADPAGLLTWRSKDRALAIFRDMRDIDAKRGAFEALIRAWIEHV